MVVSFHCEETSLYRRHYHWCGTVLHRKTWLPPFHPPPPTPLSKTHVSSTSITLALAHQTAVRSTDRKLQRLHASSLPRNPCCTTGPPSETLQTNSGSGRGFLSWAEPDLQLQRDSRKHWHQCEVMLTCIYDVRQMLHQSWTQVYALVCLTVWRHCAMCTLHGIPLLYHSHGIVRWAWMGWDYYCLSSVT